RRLRGQPLGFRDDPLPDLVRLGPSLLAGGPVLFPALLDGAAKRVKPGPQPVKVANAVRVGDRLGEPRDDRLRLTSGQIRAVHALLEQADLGLKRVELALEEGHSLVRTARLP